ncbi:uncharacterized protein J3D65DRAFT_663949 [Phyllosticta citribraziliensis]|uniref:Uncharacterized protein n=1 Tax=Phyllosticta citribraziliensis TaxID=989973 RepID=A0ABR1MA02_9PEZI
MTVAQALTDSSSAREESTPERTRLHITPFNPDLLKTFVPSSILPHASGISYHSVQTFPEKGFGFVEIPTMEAQKIKKKFNGSILRGQKVRIEDALPEKRKRVLEDIQADVAAEEPDKKPRKKAKKAKAKDGVLSGVELPDGRNVKRGWTEPESSTKRKSKDKKEKDSKNKSQSSKYTTEPEVLFKTKVPPNTVPLVKADKAVEKPKKSKKSTREVLVHEFAKTTKHAAFLKSNQIPKDAKHAAEYVEGQGWVDEEGNIVEPESDKRRKRKEAEAEAARKRAEAVALKTRTSSEASKRKTALERAEELEARKQASAADTKRQDISEDESDDASSVVSSSTSNVSSSEGEAPEDSASGESSSAESDVISQQEKDGEAAPKEAVDTEMADAVVEATDDAGNAPTEVHPLEALFKRPQLPDSDAPSKLAPINTSFSFFGGDADEEANEEQVNTDAPLTPYTRQDLQVRGVRSAAPTPDTAAVGKKFWRDEMDEDDEDVEDSLLMHHDVNAVPVRSKHADAAQEEGAGEEEQSEFAKHFWEHRGEYNRAWKKRRRESMKAQRQRENKRLGRKVV